MIEPEQTLCHLIDGNKLLLKRAGRGISEGKWNGPGGKMEPGETVEQCLKREVLEETGFRLVNPFKHGIMNFYFSEKNDPDVKVHLFSAKEFVASPGKTEDWELKWFEVDKLPLEEMWDDDKYFLGLMLAGRRFDADFWFGKDKKVARYSIRFL